MKDGTMNDNARKWVEALRSNKYKQGTGGLCNLANQHCCLGVACRVFQEEIDSLIIKKEETLFSFDGDEFTLPIVVQKWLGLRTIGGEFNPSPKNGLTYLNDDDGYSFKEIADIIESEPKGLFV